MYIKRDRLGACPFFFSVVLNADREHTWFLYANVWRKSTEVLSREIVVFYFP